MRTDPRYSRTREMLVAELPRDDADRFAACHLCQRSAYFAGGFVRLLANDLTTLARFAKHAAVAQQDRASGFEPEGWGFDSLPLRQLCLAGRPE